MPQPSNQVIIADDNEVVRNLVTLHLEKNGFAVRGVSNGQEALDALDEESEVLILDLNMPVMDGFACLEKLPDKCPQVATVILSSDTELEDAVRAMKLGAIDYLTKPFSLNDLLTVVARASRLARAERKNATLQETHASAGPSPNFIATGTAMEHLAKQAHKVAQIDSTVLLTGESGVGKGILARFIHSRSPRAAKPFVTISCPALPRDLLESELFGHEKGAFTGALKRRIGKLEAAQGGTVFLDEIGDLPLDLQPKILNVLQEREFQRLGGEATIEADIRLIAATNIDFPEKLASGEFREDLYYRLSVLPIEIPPLRDRMESLEEMAIFFLARIAKQRGHPTYDMTAELLAALKTYHWPGNVRQLENILERTSVFCEDHTLTIDDLPAEIQAQPTTPASIPGLAGIPLATIEREAILQTLAACNGNKAESARQLGITDKSVYNKIKSYNLHPAE